MSDLAATHHCGNDNRCDNGFSSLIWILILLCCCNNNDNGCGFGCGSDNLIWLIILFCICGNNNNCGFNFGCGCND